MQTKYVSYARVSTARQGRSGLGLEAQRHAVAEYLSACACQLVAEYVEVESGRRNDRAELRRALAACRLHGATLIIAKLDRLSRNASFLLTLRDNGVEFVAADMPGANRMTIGVMAMVAEQEAEAISARTKAALAAARRRGVVLGPPANLGASARHLGAAASARVRTARCRQRARDLEPIIDDLRRAGATSLRQLAERLNAQGWTTARGARWSAAQVQRVLVAYSAG
jgi:DNA invertase Pin-like site-specific DNA recombinase